jgi:hypothetical protein
MQFSSNGPSKKMNVSAEADRDFMAEVKRTDPARYQRLEKAIRTEAFRKRPDGRVCHNLNCGKDIAHLRVGSLFCSDTCKMQDRRAA